MLKTENALDEPHIKEWAAVFDKLDKDKSGAVSEAEIHAGFAAGAYQDFPLKAFDGSRIPFDANTPFKGNKNIAQMANGWGYGCGTHNSGKLKELQDRGELTKDEWEMLYLSHSAMYRRYGDGDAVHAALIKFTVEARATKQVRCLNPDGLRRTGMAMYSGKEFREHPHTPAQKTPVCSVTKSCEFDKLYMEQKEAARKQKRNPDAKDCWHTKDASCPAVCRVAKSCEFVRAYATHVGSNPIGGGPVIFAHLKKGNTIMDHILNKKEYSSSEEELSKLKDMLTAQSCGNF